MSLPDKRRESVLRQQWVQTEQLFKSMKTAVERINKDNPIIGRRMRASLWRTQETVESSVKDGPQMPIQNISHSATSSDDLAIGNGGSASGVPLAGSLGERHLWLLARRDETIIFSSLDTRVQTALTRAGCSTWGDLAVLSEDDLRAVPGVGDTTISSLHRDLERGRLRQGRPVHRAETSDIAFCEKYGWILDVADEDIEESLFDVRTLNALRCSQINTWGDLGALSDALLLEMQNVGILTVRRLNEALTIHGRKVLESPSVSSTVEEVASMDLAEVHPLTDIGLRASAEWSTLTSDNATLGELLAALDSDVKVPDSVRDEVDALFTVPLSQLSGHTPVQLGELVEELVSNADDPELLVARECVRVKPTLDELAEKQGLTRERIRQKIVADSEIVLGLFKEDDHFRAVRWATEQFQSECGLAIPSRGEVPERWRTRLGDRHFEMLRWVSGYIYKDEWLLQGSSALVDLEEALDEAIADEWLVKADELVESLSVSVNSEVALGFLLDTGKWRDIGDGWLVRWDGAIQHKAERVLRLTCRPMTPEELIEAIGHGSVGYLKNQRGSTLVRVDKEFRLALPEWEYEEYEGIVTEIEQRIDRGGGVASKTAIIEEFTSEFGVSIASININLGLPIFNVVGDSVRFADTFGFDPMPPSTVAGSVQTIDGWGERQTVTEDHMRGYSFSISPHIAWANGLRPSDRLMVKVNGSSLYEASIIWRIVNLNGRVYVGCLRTWLEDHKLGPGASLLLCPMPTGVNVYVGESEIQAARPVALPIPQDIVAMMEEL